MQGDNTDPVLTADLTNEFNMDIYVRLEAREAAAGECLARSFENIVPKLEKPSAGYYVSRFLPLGFAVLFLVVHAYFMCGLYDLKYRNAVLESVPEDDPICIGRSGSVSGFIVKSCPSCGYSSQDGEDICPVCGKRLSQPFV